jgi:hypothetical protein
VSRTPDERECARLLALAGGSAPGGPLVAEQRAVAALVRAAAARTAAPPELRLALARLEK